MQMNKITALVILIMLFGTFQSLQAQFGQPSSQEKDEFKMQKRLYIGGGLGFNMSSYGTNLMIAPVIGYRLSPSFDIGTRLTYNYFRYDDNYLKYSTNNYGAALYGRYYLFFFNDLFLHTEYEALNYEWPQEKLPSGEVITTRDWISSLFVGGGYRQWVGQSAFVGVTVLWNLLDDLNSPYSNPIFRISVGVGI